MTIPCAIYTDLTTKEDFVTDVIIFNQLKYICIATNFGNIKVFKWDSKKQTKKIIQTLKGHTRAISSMMYIPPRKVKRSQLNNKAAFVDEVLQDQFSFVSASLDGSIRIWCLEKLIELFNFNLITEGDGGGMDESIEQITLINDKLFAVFMKGHKNRVDIGQLSHLAYSYYISKSNIKLISKAFLNTPCLTQNKTESLMLSFDNNSTLLLWPEDGSIKSIVYPPPTPTSISQVIYCMSLRRVFLLLASGSLCVYKVHNRETATLDKLVLSHHLKDYEGKKLS